ncbi:hypothetical protein CRYUN_Cryun10bG0020200 [Craigia yunnanensis]
MQVLSNARNLARVLGTRTILFNSNHRFLSYLTQINSSPLSSLQCQLHTDASSGLCGGSYFPMPQYTIHLMMSRTCFSTEAGIANSNPTDAVKEFYDNMLQSVNVKRTMPPNASLWSMIENCKNHEDIKLLFDRLSNLRILSNFNCNLCQEVTRACARVGAIDFGKKALCQHNVYGLTPSIASAHHLLSYAKVHNDAKLMVEVMQLLKRNNLPLQAGTADIIFRICYNTNNWELISKYSKRFIKVGVKLRQTTFDTWMEYAVQRGDTESVWNIEKLRSETMKQHTLTTGFACAKGLLLEGRPEDAAALIQVLNQALAASLKSDIATMVASVNLEELTKKEILA